MVKTAPTGKIITGHVLDCNPRGVERALQRHDKNLYVKWNPDKLQGYGCWEVRMRPTQYSVKRVYDWTDHAIIHLDYVESDMLHHVKDVPFMNYDVVKQIKDMDTWQYDSFVDEIERQEMEREHTYRQKNREELRYKLRHNRSLARDLQNAVLQGANLNDLARHWGK